MGILDKFKKGTDEAEATEVTPKAKATSAKKPATTKKVVKKSEEKSVEQKEASIDKNMQVTKQVTGILIKPLITEKAAMLGGLNQYAFEVASDANKIQIAHAVESKYGIKPIKVNIIKNAGKVVRYGRSFGKRRATKKAIISLPEGKSIRIHEGV